MPTLLSTYIFSPIWQKIYFTTRLLKHYWSSRMKISLIKLYPARISRPGGYCEKSCDTLLPSSPPPLIISTRRLTYSAQAWRDQPSLAPITATFSTKIPLTKIQSWRCNYLRSQRHLEWVSPLWHLYVLLL